MYSFLDQRLQQVCAVKSYGFSTIDPRELVGSHQSKAQPAIQLIEGMRFQAVSPGS